MNKKILDAMYGEAVEAYKAKDYSRARQLAETLVCELPNEPNIISLLSIIHFKEGNLGAALTMSRMVLNLGQALGKQNADWWLAVGNCLTKAYHKVPALDAYENALKMAPEDPDILSSFAGFCVQYNDVERAEALAKKAIAINPDCAITHVNLGMALLSQDKWEEAWPHMEFRKNKDSWKRPKYQLLDWEGEPCETLIVHGEQGLGDELFFCSLVAQLLNRADRPERIVVECGDRLVPLLRRSLGCEVYGSMEDLADNVGLPREWLEPAKDTLVEVHTTELLSRPRIVAMGSLPHILKATRESCADNAYLVPDIARAKMWRARLAGDKPVIGVAWLGGASETHKVLRNPPREMFRCLSPDKYTLVSLQYTEGAAQQAAEMGFLHFPQAIKDIDEQAALIAACDVVVTVATAAMHIAGGLGIPTLALINQYPKWDCGRAGNAMPWWKSLIAVRQKDDDWDGVFDRVRAMLGETPAPLKLDKLGALPTGTVDLSHINIQAAE